MAAALVARTHVPTVAGALAIAAFSVAPSAHAFDAEVEASTAAQAYSLRSPFGEPVIYRRRLTQTLGLGVYKLLGDDERAGGPQIFVKMRLRLDVDFGVEETERTYSAESSSRYVPGLQQAPLDLMYGYVEGKRLFGGWFGFRAGRQYVTDALGWWSFDGALARVSAPFVNVEAYAGFEQRAGLPLSTGRFSPNGVFRGDRKIDGTDLPGSAFPMFQQASLAPAYGVALESAGPYWIHGRLDYRKVLNKDQGVATPYPGLDGRLVTLSGTRTSSERVGYAMDANAFDVVGVKGGIVYDFYNALVSSYYASIDGFVTEKITVTGEYDFYKPTFDGDSIFNWFTHSAITTATGRVAWSANDRLDVAANGGLRFWGTDDDPQKPALGPADPATGKALTDPQAKNPAATHDWLGGLNARYRWDTGRATLRGVFETGDRGKREGVDVGGQKRWKAGVWTAEARGSVYDWKDELRPDRSATSVGYVLGGGFRPSEMAQLLLEWEHNTNKLVGQRYRVLALLNLWVGK